MTDATEQPAAVEAQSNRWNRRLFLSSLASTALLGGGAAVWLLRPRVSLLTSWHQLLRGRLPLTDEAMFAFAETVAARYSSQPEAILGLLPECPGLNWVRLGAESYLQEHEVRERLAVSLAHEYDIGRVQVVDRWILCETEVLMLAISHLVGAGHD